MTQPIVPPTSTLLRPHFESTDARPRSGQGITIAIPLVGLVLLALSLYLGGLTARDPAPEVFKFLFPGAMRIDLLMLATVFLLTAQAAGWRNLPELWPTIGRQARWALLAVLAVTAVLAAFRFPEPLLALAAAAATLALGRLIAGRGDRPFVLLLATAFALRFVVAVGLSLYGLRGPEGWPVVFDDEVSYRYAGMEAAASLVSGTQPIRSEWMHLAGPFLDLQGLVFMVPGLDFTGIRLINVALSALCVALVVGTAQRVLDPRSALAAGWVLAVWPSAVFWSASGLREPLTWFTSLVVAWAVVCLLPMPGLARRFATVVLMVLCLFIVGTLRWEVGLALALGLAAAGCVLLIRRYGRAAALAVPVALVLTITILGYSAGNRSRGPEEFLRQLSPRALEYRAAAAELTPMLRHQKDTPVPNSPGEGYLPLGAIVRVRLPGEPGLRSAAINWYDYDIPGYELVVSGLEGRFYVAKDQIQPLSDETVGWGEVAARFGAGFSLLFVPPIPGGSETMKRLALAPDVLAWAALYILATASVVRAWRHQTPEWIWLWVFPFVLTLGLALASTNLGTLARHRDLVVPWLAMLAAPVIVKLWDARPSQRSLARATPRAAAES